MLSIGEFSNICKVSTKTLRYYAEIGLLEASEVNPENSYRYYAIEQGKSIMSYMDEIDVRLVDVPKMYLLSIRKMVQTEDYPTEYIKCYGKLFKKIAVDKLTMSGSPMILFHSAKYSPAGLDTEFAIPVQEYATGTRDFCPGLCLKTVVR